MTAFLDNQRILPTKTSSLGLLQDHSRRVKTAVIRRPLHGSQTTTLVATTTKVVRMLGVTVIYMVTVINLTQEGLVAASLTTMAITTAFLMEMIKRHYRHTI